MALRPASRGPLLERAALGLGLASALAIAASAFLPIHDTTAAGRAARQRAVRGAERSLDAEWGRFLRDADGHGSAARSEWVRWTPGASPPTGPAAGGGDALRPLAPRDLDPGCDERVARVDRSASEAELRAELERLRDEPPSPCRATIALRVVHVARGLGLDELARAGWGALAEEGPARRLVGFLAAAPVLGPEERRVEAERLVAAWEQGALLPPPVARRVDAGYWTTADPFRDELRARLGTWSDGEARARLESAEDGARAAALAAALDARLPAEPAPDGRLARFGSEWIAYRGRPGGGLEGRLVDLARLGGLFHEWFARVELDGEGFGVRTGTADELARARAEDPGPFVGEWRALGDLPLGAALTHAEPGRWVEDEARRLLVLRGALFGLALLVALAGLAAFRALRRVRKLAELKSAFVASVSHELRTPIASITLLAENLEKDRVDAASRPRYHRWIHREATRLRRLVDDVLDFSRLERGRGPQVALEETALAGWFAHLEEELGEWAERSEAELIVRAGPLDGAAGIDRDALRRAITNLVDNARKYGAGQPIVLRARTEAGSLVVEVEDCGPGIPAAARARIFEPFERLDPSASGPQGTGLGLAIVREIVLAHGGQVAADVPASGRGAVMRLVIPLAAEAGSGAAIENGSSKEDRD